MTTSHKQTHAIITIRYFNIFFWRPVQVDSQCQHCSCKLVSLQTYILLHWQQGLGFELQSCIWLGWHVLAPVRCIKERWNKVRTAKRQAQITQSLHYIQASHVWTARSVSNVNVLPLLTWNTYNFMLKLPDFVALACPAHLVIQGHPVGKNKNKHKIFN